MGLDTTHGCWHGAYSAFMRWREKLAEVAGIPLPLMEGFYRLPYADAMEWAKSREGGPYCGSPYGPMLHDWIMRASVFLPVSWDAFADDPLVVLLNHSDSDGEIAAEDCGPLADRLEEIIDAAPDEDLGGHIGSWHEKTRTFIEGLRQASEAGEAVGFH